MLKRLFVSLIVVASAAVPSVAFGSPVLTHPTGTVLPTGTKITATNVGNITFSSGIGNLTCSTAKLTGTLNTNTTSSGTAITITSAVFGGTGKVISGEPEPECTGSGFLGDAGVRPGSIHGLPWCFVATSSTDFLTYRGGSCSEISNTLELTFQVTTLFGTVSCIYWGEDRVSGSLETDNVVGQDATISFVERSWVKAGGGGECPASTKLSMTLTLETDAFTASPMYFSS